MRPRFEWDLGRRRVCLGERTLVMGVLNVTPDSFSDGGLYFDPAAALAHALRMLDEGADIIDIGGESTRPGARAGATADEPLVSAEEEQRRVVPVIRELKRQRPEALVSVDTYKSSVSQAAVAAGAEIVNDISGFRWDAAMAATVAKLGCGAVLMHTRGRPEEWRSLPPVDDVIGLVTRGLSERAAAAVAAGVPRERLVLDPGFGFGKNYEQNYPLLGRFEEFHRLGYPLMAGVSRKSFIGGAVGVGRDVAAAEKRLMGSLAAATICMMKGVHILRVHDVKPTVEAAAVVDAILGSAS